MCKKLKVDSGGVFDSATVKKFIRDKQTVCLVFLPLEGGCLTTRSPHSIKMTSRPSLTSIPRIPTQQQLRVSTRSLLPGQLLKYFVSSSHNTSLIGYQLIGDSMIEGYIRPLLHSCRSVECQSFSSRRIIISCSNWLAC